MGFKYTIGSIGGAPMRVMALAAWVACLSLLTVTQASHVVHNVDAVSEKIDQRYRTAYHFQPYANWMNDPNGPMFYKGFYHLFYQYNPKAAVWGTIIWGHVVSKDLIHWQSLPPAIVPSEWYDIKGCWSGAATFLAGGKPAILYTGWDNSSQQVQNMVVPKNLSDPLLKEWVKIPQNPIIIPEFGINGSSFRDPTTGWLGSDGKWKIIIGSKKKHRGMALLYRSKDFIHWEKAKHPLHSSKRTGMWECPDFYPVPLAGKNGLDTSVVGSSVKHVLKVSLDDYKYEYYTVGKYLVSKDQYIPDKTSPDDEKGLRYDYGKFYASKTFFDDHTKRRILLSWVNESDSESDDIAKGWAGVHIIPRTVWLDSTGSRLIQWPISEVESLRGKKTSWTNFHLKSGSVTEIPRVKGAQVDVEVFFNLPSLNDAELVDLSTTTPQQLCSQRGAATSGVFGPFGLLVLASKDLNEHTAVFFWIVRYQRKLGAIMCSDQSRSSLRTDVDKTTYGSFVPLTRTERKRLALRVLVDHSIVESFGVGGKSCITARVYPTLAIGNDAHLYVFNNGSSPIGVRKLSAWDMAISALHPYFT